MKLATRWLTGGMLAGVLALSACGSADAETVAGAADGVGDAPPEVARFKMIQEVLAKVTLRPEQKAEIEQLIASAEARHETTRIAHVALRSALADQVLAGKVDRDALKPSIDALVSTIDRARPADKAAFARVHALLDKSQRNQFADAIEAAVFARMRGALSGRHGPSKWAADLNLTSSQRDQIQAAMREQFHRPGGEQRPSMLDRIEEGKKLLDTFRSDTFTLDAVATPFFGAERARLGVERLINVASSAVPILTPGQRAIAAAKLRREGLGR